MATFYDPVLEAEVDEQGNVLSTGTNVPTGLSWVPGSEGKYGPSDPRFGGAPPSNVSKLLFGHDISHGDFWKRRGFTDEDLQWASRYGQVLPTPQGGRSLRAVDPTGLIPSFQGHDIEGLFAGKFSPETDPERMRGLLEEYAESIFGRDAGSGASGMGGLIPVKDIIAKSGAEHWKGTGWEHPDSWRDQFVDPNTGAIYRMASHGGDLRYAGEAGQMDYIRGLGARLIDPSETQAEAEAAGWKKRKDSTWGKYGGKIGGALGAAAAIALAPYTGGMSLALLGTLGGAGGSLLAQTTTGKGIDPVEAALMGLAGAGAGYGAGWLGYGAPAGAGAPLSGTEASLAALAEQGGAEALGAGASGTGRAGWGDYMTGLGDLLGKGESALETAGKLGSVYGMTKDLLYPDQVDLPEYEEDPYAYEEPMGYPPFVPYEFPEFQPPPRVTPAQVRQVMANLQSRGLSGGAISPEAIARLLGVSVEEVEAAMKER